MQEQLISFETAKLAKEKGFDQQPYRAADNKCSAYYPEYTDGSGKIRLDHPLFNLEHIIAIAPTQSLLQKWLREVHKIHINITKVYECSKSPAKFDGWNIYIAGKDFETHYLINDKLISTYFSSYEEALEEGLKEALNLI